MTSTLFFVNVTSKEWSMAKGESFPVRLDAETIERVETLARMMTKRTGGATFVRSEVIRTALRAGLTVLEETNGVKRGKSRVKA